MKTSGESLVEPPRKVSARLGVVLIACAMLLAALAHSSERSAGEMKYAKLSDVTPINIPGIDIDARFARIKSWEELQSHMQASDDASDALAKLSPQAEREFLDSLVFTELGLASFNGRVLARELSASQIYELLGLFGLQRMAPLVAADARIDSELDKSILELAGVDSRNGNSGSAQDCPLLENYECTPPATCRRSTGAWCITCNCGMIPP